MATIGVIDDRDEDRNMIVETISLANKEEGWNIVDKQPLKRLDEYPAWIGQNKICALVIDELLDEVINDGTAVDYKGHDLVDFLRNKFPTLPIFVITAHAGDPSLQERFKDVEGIVDRREYGRMYNNYVPRFIRAAQQYLKIFREELNQLSIFAQKVATGEATSVEEQELAQAIQTKLDIAYSTSSLSGISTWVNEATLLIDKIEILRKEIQQKLEKE